jgi:hypothetical protein
VTKYLNACLVSALIASGLATPPVSAQTPPPAAIHTAVPIKVQVVLSRYQGEKKISSMPYTLAFNVLDDRLNVSNIRMGSKIPIKMMSNMTVGGEKMPTPGPIQYQDVGTNIDCRTIAIGDGRYAVEVTVDDTSVYGEDSGKQADQPSFRSFRATNSMILKDGQSGQYTSAVDKVTGEVTKIDVTLTVVK